jgi:large subunit ribosomal protein L15
MKKQPAKAQKTAQKSNSKTEPVTVKKPKQKKVKASQNQAVSAQAILSLGLHNLPVPTGAHKRKKILGRGPGSGHGKTSTRGSKGQTSRSGRDFYPGFEGGQMPLIRKIPKRGFANPFRQEYQIVSLQSLKKISAAAITLDVLEKQGLIKDKSRPVKILGDGEFAGKSTVQAHAFSKSAREKIEQAGGKIEVVHV